MPSFDRILKKLAKAQDGLLRAAEAVPAGSWASRPREGCWSAAEVIAHVTTIERMVVAAASRILRKEPKQIPLLERFHLPLAFAEIRVVRLKTPIPLDPQLLREKELMLAELREVRGHTLALIEGAKDRNLRMYRWRHPILGSLNTYQWIELLGSHQIRHEKQVREIAADLSHAIPNRPR